MKDSQPIITDVTGGSGSGKTSVSHAIFNNFPDHSVMMLEQDSYCKDQNHLSFKERLNTNYNHSFAFSTDLLVQHVEQLLNCQTIKKPACDYAAYIRNTETVIQEPKEVIILEGILISEDRRLRDLMDIKVYVDTDDDIRITRRIKRGMKERGRILDSVIKQYLVVVKPMYYQFIEPTECYADIIMPEGGEDHIAIDLTNTEVDSILAKM